MKNNKLNKSISFPKLTRSEKIWLDEIINAYFKREKTDLISLRVKLTEKLEKNFDHKKIDYSLLKSDTIPTLYAVWTIDPDNTIINLAERVLKTIKHLIVEDSTRRGFNSVNISEKLDYEGDEMDLCFELIYSLGMFFTSASGSSSKINGYESLQVDSITAIDSILKFEDIQTTLNYIKIGHLTRSKIKVKKSKTGKNKPLKTKLKTAFIIMRMGKDYPEGLEICKTIKEVCKTFNINAIRADDVEHSEEITNLILKKITLSDYLIVDLSGERPNVYYEVGYAHAIKRKPILYRKKGTKLHFDLSVHNVPEYESIDDLRRLLTNRLTVLMRKINKN